MNKKIDLFDLSFAHIDKNNHGMAGIKPTYFDWCRDGQTHEERIAFFTEDYIYSPDIQYSNAKLNVGWLVETREISPQRYDLFHLHNKKLDFVITHDSKLLRDYPERTVFAPFGGCWIDRKDHNICEKSKLVSMIFSNKNFMPGHNMRQQIYKEIKEKIDFYGTGCGIKVDKKDETIKDYMFSVVVENSKTDNYFTEKLLDCFAYGTIPIFWGCSNIGEYFDEKGIIQFDSLGELQQIVSHLNHELYSEKLNHVRNNFVNLLKYDIPEDWIYKNILEKEFV